MSNSPKEPRAQIVVYRYVEREEAGGVRQLLGEAGVPLLSDGRHGTKSGAEDGLAQQKQSAPKLWDYPDFQVDEVLGSKFSFRVQKKVARSLTLAKLERVTVIYLADPPDHYPYEYVFGYHFSVRPDASARDSKSVLEMMEKATLEVKSYTDTFSPTARYRPVFWFLSDFRELTCGLRGVRQTVKEPSLAKSIEIERAFPHASYILYDVLPSESDLRLTDLGLVAVVPHAVERGIRADLSRIVEEIRDSVSELDGGIGSRVGNQSGLRAELDRITGIQTKLRHQVDEVYRARRRLIRLRGLVQRVRQVAGHEPSHTYLDVVCADALTQIADEVAMSEEQIETSIRAINERVADIYRKLNDQYGKLATHHTHRLQRVAILLQATGVAFVVFQVANSLWITPDSRGTPPEDVSFLVEHAIALRSAALVTMTLIAFFLTVFGLRRWIDGGRND